MILQTSASTTMTVGCGEFVAAAVAGAEGRAAVEQDSGSSPPWALQGKTSSSMSLSSTSTS